MLRKKKIYIYIYIYLYIYISNVYPQKKKPHDNGEETRDGN